MRVLVTGAYGFIGSQIVASLSAEGHEVVCAVRGARVDERFVGPHAVACDMAIDVRSEDWQPRLAGIDAVVNCAGILRESRNSTFEAVHVQAPLALFRACVHAGIRRVIQVSALGDPADGEFIASKHRADVALSALDLEWLVLRPSIVCSPRGSYGGTSLLRALAALPGLLILPGDGAQRLQPLLLEDLGRIVAMAVARPQIARETFEVAGPEVLSVTQYLRLWRHWLGYRAAREWHIPLRMVRFAASLGERVGRGPFGLTMQRMLERGNVAASNAWARVRDCFGVAARPLAAALAEVPAQTQDRWQARLYVGLPVLRVAMGLLWIASGLLGLLLPDAAVAVATRDGVWALSDTLLLARASGVCDLLLGVLCLARWRPRWVLAAMSAMLAGYTVGIGIGWPQHWLDPFGGLLKNLPLLAALGVLLATEERR